MFLRTVVFVNLFKSAFSFKNFNTQHLICILEVVFHCVKYFLNFVSCNGGLRTETQNDRKRSLLVLYQSRNFIVVDKAYDVVINSNDPSVKESLERQLIAAFPSFIIPKLRHSFYFVHRLDYSTSGVICVALHKKACSAATTAFETRQTKKYYIAILRGHVALEVMDIDAPVGELASERNGSHMMCVGDSGSECLLPRKAYTRLLVIQRGIYDGYPATKVLLRPITGRRHQLRVHCAYIGHTIVGDFTYSRKRDVSPFRTFLHSLRLVLPNEIESLDIQTSDPFLDNGIKSGWIPVETINSLENKEVFKKLDLESEVF